MAFLDDRSNDRRNRTSRRRAAGALRKNCRPLVERLEDRCLLDAIGLLDAPWRGFDTGYYPNAFGPNSIAVGDLDADGDPDAVVSNSFFNKPGLSVLRNQGNATYGKPQIVSLPYNKSVGEVALADVDRDADLDALVTIPDINGLTNQLALYRNNGNGVLSRRAQIFTTGPGPQGLVVADFTGDSFPDVVTANYGYIAGNNPTISLLKHNGKIGPAAGFLAPVSYTVGANPERVAAADLNSDGSIDLVVGRTDYVSGYETPILHVLTNDGAGVFAESGVYLLGSPPDRAGSAAVGLGDIDNDGDVDLIGGGGIDVGSVSYGYVSVLRNDGNAVFGTPERYVFEKFVWTPSSITTADMNGDGSLDIIATTPSGRANDGYNILLNTGTGAFETPTFYEASQQTYDAAAADADGDGDLDVLTVAKSSAVITVHRNMGDGSFAVLPKSAAGGFAEGLDAADIDKDGDLDVVTNDDKVRILRNHGNGTFAAAQDYTPPKNMADLKLRDLNGDTFVDLLLGPDDEAPPYHFVTALNNGDGSFAAGKIWNVFSCGGGTIDAFDMDGDGDLDVVLTEEAGCLGGDPPRIFLYRNNGTGVFTPAGILFPPGFATGIAGADLNHDGNMDLVTSLGAGVGVYLGNGDLTFQAPLISSTRPYRFTLADLNNDGDLDVAMIVPQDSFGTVYIGAALGNGDGTFQPAKQYPGASVLESAYLISHDIDTADINVDGIPDVLVTNDASNDLSLFLGNGDGTLQPQHRYGAGYAAWLSYFGDFTGDTVPDVATYISLPPSGFAGAVVLLPGVPTSAPAPGFGRLPTTPHGVVTHVSHPAPASEREPMMRLPRSSAGAQEASDTTVPERFAAPSRPQAAITRGEEYMDAVWLCLDLE